MFEAHQAHPIYEGRRQHITDAKTYVDNFMEWYRAGLQSGDVPFVFYSGFVLGVGLLYRIAKQAISNRDNLMCYALLLPAMGLFKLTSKHNLCLQCFLSLLKLMSSTEEVAQALLANITQTYSGRKSHAIATDALLELLLGLVKGKTGKQWDPTTARMHSGCNFFFNRVRNQMEQLTEGPKDGNKTKGQHVAEAYADTLKVATALRPMELFAFDSPRSSIQELKERMDLFKDGFKLPAAYVHADWGGPINFTKPFSSNATPVFTLAAKAAKEFLHRGGHPSSAVADHDFAPQEHVEGLLGGLEDEDSMPCDHCATPFPKLQLHVCCVCSGNFCPQCSDPSLDAAENMRVHERVDVDLDDEVDGDDDPPAVNYWCRLCVDVEGAEQVETEARREARLAGNEAVLLDEV
mmetsp:Transcript_22855/g.55043  ORF Transcript_22855/g.55043 Transcript_22855/m.55043 type:complete len:407 (-) Transcript_22855:1912-3132(-)